MKQTAVKFILRVLGNKQLLKTLTVKFWLIAQAELQNGEVNFNNPQQT
jgi:hypothetical protein